MYGNILHQGITIAEWVKIFHGEYTPFELYRMITEGVNLRKIASGC